MLSRIYMLFTQNAIKLLLIFILYGLKGLSVSSNSCLLSNCWQYPDLELVNKTKSTAFFLLGLLETKRLIRISTCDPVWSACNEENLCLLMFLVNSSRSGHKLRTKHLFQHFFFFHDMRSFPSVANKLFIKQEQG